MLRLENFICCWSEKDFFDGHIQSKGIYHALLLTIQIIMWTTQIWRSKRFECAKRKSSNRRKKKQCWLRTVVGQHIHHSLLSRGPVAVCVLLVPFGLNGWMQRLAALNVLLNESSICFLIQIQTLHPPESPFKLWSFKQTMKAKMRHISAALLALVLLSCTWMTCVSWKTFVLLSQSCTLWYLKLFKWIDLVSS